MLSFAYWIGESLLQVNVVGTWLCGLLVGLLFLLLEGLGRTANFLVRFDVFLSPFAFLDPALCSLELLPQPRISTALRGVNAEI